MVFISGKNMFLIFFIFLIVCNAQAQSVFFQKVISPDGTIRKEFWNALPKQCPSSDGAKVVQRNGLSKLVFDSASIIKNDFGSDKCISVVENLMKVLTDVEVYKPDVDIVKIDERFYLFFAAQTYYLLDTKTDTAYFLMESNYGNLRYKIVRLEKIEKDYGYEKNGADAWRFFFQYAMENGRSTKEPLMTVYDVDCNAKKNIGSVNGSFCEDLSHDDHFELVSRDEVDFYLNWDWVYCWKNGCWVDCSTKFPEYYKTTVVMNLEKLTNSPVKVLNKILLNLLIQAAQKGGPVAFVQ